MLLDVGATEIDLVQHMPDNFDDLSGTLKIEIFMIAARRTTFEWVLRQIVMSNADVVIRTGERIRGLVATEGDILEVQV